MNLSDLLADMRIPIADPGTVRVEKIIFEVPYAGTTNAEDVFLSHSEVFCQFVRIVEQGCFRKARKKDPAQEAGAEDRMLQHARYLKNKSGVLRESTSNEKRWWLYLSSAFMTSSFLPQDFISLHTVFTERGYPCSSFLDDETAVHEISHLQMRTFMIR